ncbi:hypothetical protein QR680_017225 [Steinernema hermaphroditum]|uniref:26S proteasome non-ATPase regulatory subunit 1 n=1 Tax=Steinernema hermaphroditum TaxID=289476 RepID=A0AA39HDT7_9BILA|nr:hypothetical protein QR680_017225 [Steinernema hermaphroditum]
MTLYLLNQWKNQVGGPQDASAFMLALSSEKYSQKDKALIIETFDDWEVLTPTWFEVADYISDIERLYEDMSFEKRLKAALLASKVAYCLGDYSGSLDLALAAEDAFKLTPRPAARIIGPQDEQYVNKIIEQALDTYKAKRQAGEKNVDTRLEALVNRIFERNMKKHELRYVIGLALDTRRLDMLEAAVKQNKDQAAQTTLLTETVAKVLSSQLESVFRGAVLDTLFRLFSELNEPDFVSMCECLIKLDKPEAVAHILNRLVHNKNELLAYQLSFDLYENATQRFIDKIEKSLAPGVEDSAGTTEATTSSVTTTDSSVTSTSATSTVSTTTVTATSTDGSEEDSETVSEQASSVEKTETEEKSAMKMAPEVNNRLRRILRGEETIKHHMQFLIKNNKTDMLVLKQIKDSVRTASAHNATVIANGLMHVGTTCDDFLRDNLEWISKATNWNKFNAVATLGLIHKGHEAKALQLLDPYLPKETTDQFGFKEGGSLYAYGLMHVNHGNEEVIKYLMDQLSKGSTAAVKHGACLGLGLAAMGTHSDEVYQVLRDALYQDDAVIGEAAATAMGLVMVGSLNTQVLRDMEQYIYDTQHDKIERGLRTGMALLAYGRQDEVEQSVNRLLDDKAHAILRQTGVCMLAMAYAGTGKADVVRRLLAKVAADPNNDVKRFAVIAIGFVLSNDPEQCISYTGMLVEHFNGHVRYGAAVALGIACAGSGYKEAIALLEPLLAAKENFVRQGAIIALSFILIQQTEPTCSKVVEYRKTLNKMITEKGEDSITKFGAIIAQGILDAGGRNVTISLHNRTGQPDMTSVVGTFIFLQHWYWHSMAHFASLSFRPTCLIGLNKDLQMPKTEFRSNAKASMFAYPPPLEEKKKEESEKVETAVLSVTNKKKLTKKDKQEKEAAEEKMEVDGEEQAQPKDVKDATVKSEEKKEPEASTHTIQNPARAVRLQLKTLSMPDNTRYKPLKALSQGGIIMLRDKKEGLEKEDIVELVAAGGSSNTSESSKTEPEPPAPFEIVVAQY